MSQPKWKCVANLGDVNPIEHGGLFVFIDETGVYPPEAEKLIPPCEDGPQEWVAYRFILENCTHINGVLSDNQFHPDHPAWFAGSEQQREERPQDSTYLQNICNCMDVEAKELIGWFCSDDPCERARAWECVGDYHGYENLDSEPRKLNRKEVFGRFNSRINMLWCQEKKAREAKLRAQEAK